MLDLDTLAEHFARQLAGERVAEFLPEDGDVYAANVSVLGYREDDDIQGLIVAPVAKLLLGRVEDLKRPADGVWRLRWAAFPGDLMVELAAPPEGAA